MQLNTNYYKEATGYAKDIASQNKPAILMSKKATLNTLQALQGKFAKKIAEENPSHPDLTITEFFVPLYEIAAAIRVLTNCAYGTNFCNMSDHRSALAAIEKQLCVLHNKACEALQTEVNCDMALNSDTLHDIQTLKEFAKNLLA